VFAKTPQIKKPDGKPLMRKDIQFALLSHIFHDDKAVFTSSYDASAEKMTFSELFVESMARSSKCSRVVRDKMQTDTDLAISVAMVSLLVNVGKMNTTLTCNPHVLHTKLVFPEMRAQLRTYHSIPSLQYGQAQHAKLLQDAPRIKSILKGVQEDRNEPFTWEQLLECRKRGLKPLTSPVSLIFLFGTYCQKITQSHFAPPREFYDLFNKTELSSVSRANAFLWLCWQYLETDGSLEAAEHNPFGIPGEPGTLQVPTLESISSEQEALENEDPPEEVAYGQRMEEERKRYLDSEQHLKENSSTDKLTKKSRGGIASRQLKAKSIAAQAARTKVKIEKTQNEAEESRNSTPSKAGDLSFVLNEPQSPPRSTPSKSPHLHPQGKSTPARSTPGFAEQPPSFAQNEPAHNRMSTLALLI
jgi:Ino eighty subunit 1